MNENTTSITLEPKNSSGQPVVHKIVNVANLGLVPSGQDNIHRFAAKTVNAGTLVLVTLDLKESLTALLIVNTEKTAIGSMLLREIKTALSQA
ncbi:AP3B1 protein, partial [Polypterus senegalus]